MFVSELINPGQRTHCDEIVAMSQQMTTPESSCQNVSQECLPSGPFVKGDPSATTRMPSQERKKGARREDQL